MDKTKIVNFKGKDYKVKYSLSESEFIEFVATVIGSIFNEKEDALPYFLMKPLIFNKAVLQYYVDVTEKQAEKLVKEFDDDGKKFKDYIEEVIYSKQYAELKQALDAGIDYTIKLQFHQESVENKIDKLMNRILEFTSNMPKWAEFVNKLLENGEAQKIIDILTPMAVKYLNAKK